MNKSAFITLILILLAFSGCIKETYDMSKLSDDVTYSPTFSVSAVTGKITLGDILKSNDTVRFDDDNFVRIVYRKDSVFSLRLEDFYDLNDMVSYSNGYTVGEIMMDDIHNVIPVTLNTISQYFLPSLRSAFLALDDGSPHNFPLFPGTTIPEQSFSLFTHFQSVVLSSGTLEISVKNNLQAPLNSITIRLYNFTGHQLIGNEMTIPAIDAGATGSAIMNLAGKTVTNRIVAEVVFNGSPGTESPVIIDMDHTVEVGIHGENLKVQSGKLKVPSQTINSIDNLDTISFDPGENVEIEKLRIENGNIRYHLISKCFLTASLTINLPTSLRSGTPVNETINVNAGTDFTGNINVSNTELDLSTDPKQRYNRIPVIYSATVSSNGNMIDFKSSDSIHIDMEIINPGFDYVRGYFGQLTEQIDTDTLETGIEDILDHLTGQFHISDPSIRVNYSNSFGIPVEVTLNATGVKKNQMVNLDLAPFNVAYPTSTSVRKVTSSFTVSKTNSKLPDLISLPPSEIRFSGSARMNPQGFTGERNNYLFGNSSFTGSLEIEVPMAFWINNLQFSDTLDNFFKSEEGEESSFDPGDMELFLLNISVKNGFPLGASLKLILYDSDSKSVIKSIDAEDIIKAAPVDADGRATGISESSTTIKCDKTFFEASRKADKIIFVFSMSTSGDGTSDVRIYSDYSLSFKASVKVKPGLNKN